MSGKPKNILIVYDEKVTFIKTVEEHIVSFRKHSRHNIFYVPGTIGGAIGSNQYQLESNKELARTPDSIWNFDNFDVIILHYSVRLSLRGYIDQQILDRIKNFRGPKALFIQDEYEGVNTARAYIKELGITTIFTCVPLDQIDRVYPKAELPDVTFIRTLTGYVPETEDLERYALPLPDRSTLIGYRGRKLPHHYGQLGYEKFEIGERMRAEAHRRGFTVDIESADDKRIYGSWYQFVGSIRATLGTESGSNLFDFDGSLAKRARALIDEPFEDVYAKEFKIFDDYVPMNQISPKFFEAIRLGTALVCYRGDYSGILIADEHYIPLEKDFSNVGDVFAKLTDLDALIAMTNRAYRDVIQSELYSYKTFVAGVDDWVDATLSSSKARIISVPIAVVRGDIIQPILHDDAIDYVLNDHALGGTWERSQFRALFERRTVVIKAATTDTATRMIDRARAEDGASIMASTTFHPRPHDADSLLRPIVSNNYAAALDGNELPHFIEIDLGTARNVEKLFILWYSPDHYGVDFRLEGRTATEDYETLVDVLNNVESEGTYTFAPTRIRYCRLTVSRIEGQQRILMRELALSEHQHTF